MEPAVYFPVTTTPLAMRAGLQPFGLDLGNGERDAHFFQRDDRFADYQRQKRAIVDDRHDVVDDTDAHRDVHKAALRFVRERLLLEHATTLTALADLDDDCPLAARWQAVAGAVQEDIALLHRGVDDDGDAIMLNVCFPSGWRPEQLRRASFAGIHVPVPDFVKDPRAAQSMVRSMVERGPYVRFVWTISADDVLDHHPKHGRRRAFDDDVTEGFLRIERQVTVPFADVGGSLFLIRTYLRSFTSLDIEERATLREALAVMPAEIAAYKGLAAGHALMMAMLDRV